MNKWINESLINQVDELRPPSIQFHGSCINQMLEYYVID